MDSLVAVLPNLSIGVISIGALVVVVMWFLAELKQVRKDHEKAMYEREIAMRDLERSVRTSLTEHLTQAAVALQENTKMLARVVRHLDGDPI